jgi:hypothetical protein
MYAHIIKDFHHKLEWRPMNAYWGSFLLGIGFTKSQADTNIYVQWASATFLFIGLYVDDTILVNNHIIILLFYTK